LNKLNNTFRPMSRRNQLPQEFISSSSCNLLLLNTCFQSSFARYNLSMATFLTVLLQKNAIFVDPWVLMKVVFLG